MSTVYGYCRISTKQQSIDRQERNIRAAYPNAVISKEAFTGTKIQGRKELDKILRAVRAGDCIVFDSVSRMSRNASEGVGLYEKLFNKGVELCFLREPYCNTAVYRHALERQISITADTGDKATDTFVNAVIQALKQFQMDLARRQIELAFEQAEKEVTDLHQRTKEGIETARLQGKQIGQRQGATLNVKKKALAKDIIRRHNIDFDGTLDDGETIKLAGISRNTFYKYKRELRMEIAGIQAE